MPALAPRFWLARRLENAFNRAYRKVRVNPERYLFHLRAAHGLPVATFRGMYTLPVETLDAVAERTIRSATRLAAIEGVGLGLGGILTIVPDLSILAAINLRTIQKLSLIYGFEFNTDEEVAELWLAAASAAGVDLSRELLEKEVINRFVPRIIRRIAVEASSEIVDKWAGRLVPVASSLIGGGLNYYFVRAWGERARRHFRARHLLVRQQFAFAAQKEVSALPAGPGREQ